MWRMDREAREYRSNIWLVPLMPKHRVLKPELADASAPTQDLDQPNEKEVDQRQHCVRHPGEPRRSRSESGYWHPTARRGQGAGPDGLAPAGCRPGSRRWPGARIHQHRIRCAQVLSIADAKLRPWPERANELTPSTSP